MKLMTNFLLVFGLITLFGCTNPPRDLDGLQSKITNAESGPFRECMAQAHKAEDLLDTAKKVLGDIRKNAYWVEDNYYEKQGHIAADEALVHIQQAEDACDRYLQPLLDRIIRNEQNIAKNSERINNLEARVRYLESLHTILQGVTFHKNSADLTSRSLGILNAVAKSLIHNPSVKEVTVEGHTSSEGSDEHNMDLSQRRAESVKNHLVQQGVDANILNAAGHGSSNPVADNNTNRGRSKNRRVELKRN